MIVVGAGIAGLTAAWRLQQRGFAVTVLEAAGQPGGRMAERQTGPIVYNTGARLVYPFGKDFNALVRDAGMAQDVIELHSPVARCSDDSGDYRLELMPGPGSVLTDRLPWRERVRLVRYACALLARRRRLCPDDLTSALQDDEITLAVHVGQRIGPHFLHRFIEPLFRGTRSWNPEEISAAFFVSTLPHLLGERRVLSFRGGMGRVTAQLAASVPVRLNCEVGAVRRLETGGCEVACREEGRTVTLHADLVLMATEGDRVGALLCDPLPQEREFFSSVRYNSLAVVHYAVSGTVVPGVRFFRRDASGPLATYQQLAAAPQAGRSLAQLYCQLTPEAATEAAAADTRELDAFVRVQVRTLFPELDTRCVATHTQWIRSKLPVPWPGYGHAVSRFLDWQQGERRSVYYCGDYLSQALVTGAAHSGTTASALIAAHYPRIRNS